MFVGGHWGIGVQEAEDRLVWAKQQAAIQALKQYLKLQGYSKAEINYFVQENMAIAKIRHKKDLWKLRNRPEKLLEAIKTDKRLEE